MKEKPRYFVIISYIMVALFLLSAAVQYNDPDALVWMGIYGSAALLTLFFVRDKLHWSLPALLALAVLTGGGILGYEAFFIHGGSMGNTWQMHNPAQEAAREAGGLLVIGIWSIVMIFAIRTCRK